jgi:hypothetical protein
MMSDYDNINIFDAQCGESPEGLKYFNNGQFNEYEKILDICQSFINQ